VEPTAGIILLAAAIAAMFRIQTSTHAFLGAALLVAGGIHLFLWQAAGATDTAREGINLALGALFLLFGIQQYALTSPNELLRSARRRAEELPDLDYIPKSELVRNIARASLAAGGLLGAYAFLAIAVNGFGDHAWRIGGVTLPPFLSNADATIGATLAVVCLAIAAVLPRLRNPAYMEARISSQFLAVVTLLFAWGVVMSFRFDAPLAFLDGVFANGAAAFLMPQAWVTLILAVLAANRVFARSVDRELDHARL